MKGQLYLKLQNLAIDTYTFRIEICKVMTILSALYILLSLFQIHVLMGFGIMFMSVLGLFYFKWRNLRQKGLINIVSPKLKKLLLERSIYDLYRDQVYYPYITKIIGALGKGAISKPHPEQLDQIINNLPQNIRMAICTKGILHLAPQKLQRLIIQRQPDLLAQISQIPQAKPQLEPSIPKTYGTINPTWDRINQYQKQEVKIHEHTISKQLLIRLNQKIKWGHIITLASLVAFAVTKTKGKKLGKILLYNGSVMGIMAVAALTIIKYKKPFHSNKKNKD